MVDPISHMDARGWSPPVAVKAYPPLRTLHVIAVENGRSEGMAGTPADPWRVEPDVIPEPHLTQCIADAMALGLDRMILAGDDPLLHPALPAILILASRLRLEVEIETNGVALTDELLEILRASDRVRVSVRLESCFPVRHDSAREIDGAFATAVRSIGRMRGYGIRPQIVASLTFRNAGELRDLVAFATQLEASRIRIDSIGSLFRYDRRSQPGTGLSAFEILSAHERLFAWMSSDVAIPVVLDLPPAFVPAGGPAHVLVARPDWRTSIGVLPSGRLALGAKHAGSPRPAIGAAAPAPLRDLWTGGAELSDLRAAAGIDPKSVCARCLKRDMCPDASLSSACIARNLPCQAPRFCERAWQDGLFPGGRMDPAAQMRDTAPAAEAAGARGV